MLFCGGPCTQGPGMVVDDELKQSNYHTIMATMASSIIGN
jgi:NADH:ubiquinone oxidoreductase subunit E